MVQVPRDDVHDLPWAPFPESLSAGGIRWKLLHASCEAGAWAAIFLCPRGSSFNAHVHQGPGEYRLLRGRMDVHGEHSSGGDVTRLPGCGYESAGARHDVTHFPEETEFTMTFLGPLLFPGQGGAPDVVFGCQEVRRAWNAFLAAPETVRRAA